MARKLNNKVVQPLVLKHSSKQVKQAQIFNQHFFLLGRPQYRVDSSESVYTRHRIENGENVFYVEQGTRFYLKLVLTANPMPTECDLYEDGRLVQSSPWGRIYLRLDSFEIRSVQGTDEGYYRMTCSNIMGEGSFSFRLRVQGMCSNH